VTRLGWPVVALAAIAIAPLAAQEIGAPAPNEYGRAQKLEVQPFETGNKQIRLEFPKKDWDVVPANSAPVSVPGVTWPIVSIVQKRRDAAIVVEGVRLHQPLAQDDITDLFGELESSAIRERQSLAKDLQAKVVQAGGRRLVIVTYNRQGTAGAERVRQYTIPGGGADLYRLTCSATTAQFARYEAVFAHVAASFTVAGGGTQ